MLSIRVSNIYVNRNGNKIEVYNKYTDKFLGYTDEETLKYFKLREWILNVNTEIEEPPSPPEPTENSSTTIFVKDKL